MVRLEKHDPGPQHPEAILSIDLLGQCELTLENLTAGEGYLSAALDQLEKNLAQSHFHVIFSTGNMAILR